MIEEKGAETLAVLTDVSRPEDVDELAKKTVSTFGGVHILCNNAGALKGVIHGFRSFVPIMVAQNDEAHIVNTSLVSGILRI